MTSYQDFIYFINGIAFAFFVILAAQNLWQRGNRLRLILGGILVYWAFQQLLSVLFTADFLTNTRALSHLFNAIDMTATPTCCFLLMELTRPGWLTWKRVFWLELPFFVFGALIIFTDNNILYYILIGFFVIYGITFANTTIINILKYNRFLKEHYSYDENINLRWLYFVLFTFFTLMIVYAICSVHDTLIGDTIYLIGAIVSWSWICFCIQRQESVLDELESTRAEESIQNKEVDTEPNPVKSNMLEQLIEKHFVKPQVYLNPQLKLGDMAQIIGTNRTYLSRYLNDQLHTTFYDYVNTLRLAYACQLIEDTDESIMNIVSNAGFNSYSTFRRTFIAKYGISPQEYRNNHK